MSLQRTFERVRKRARAAANEFWMNNEMFSTVDPPRGGDIASLKYDGHGFHSQQVIAFDPKTLYIARQGNLETGNATKVEMAVYSGQALSHGVWSSHDFETNTFIPRTYQPSNFKFVRWNFSFMSRSYLSHSSK